MFLTIILIIIYIAFISLGLPDSLLGSAWPTMYNYLNVDISYAGIVSMIIASGTILSSIFSSKFIKRYGCGKVTTVSVLLTAIALLGFSFSSKFYHLCLFAIPLGLGAGSVDAALNNFVANHYKVKHMSFLHAFWGAGATTGPIIMSYFLKRGYLFRSGYFVISMIQFTLVFILIITLPLWKKTKDINTESKIDLNPTTKVSLLPGFYNVLIAFFCYCAIEATIGLWGSTYVVMVHGISKVDAARWASLFYIGITIGRIISGIISSKLNSRKLIYLGILIIGVGLTFILLALGNITLLTGFFLLGLGCAPIFPSLLHQTPENFGSENSTKIMGLQMACAYIGTTFMPPLFGFLGKIFGYYIFIVYIPILLIILLYMVKKLNLKVILRKKEYYVINQNN